MLIIVQKLYVIHELNVVLKRGNILLSIPLVPNLFHFMAPCKFSKNLIPLLKLELRRNFFCDAYNHTK